MNDASQPLETTLVRPSEWTTGAALAPPAPTFSAGMVIQKALSAWWKNVVPFSILSMLAFAPLIAGTLWFTSAMGTLAGGVPRPPSWFESPAGIRSFVLALGVGTVVMTLLYAVASAALCAGTFHHLRGTRVGLGGMLGQGLRRILPVSVAMWVAWIPISVGCMMLLVPGLMLATVWAVCLPACATERRGPLGCLGRSAELTRGHRWQVFLAILALYGVVWVASFAFQMVAGVGTAALSGALGSPEQRALATLAISQLGNGLFGMLPVVGTAAAYHELRVAREGLDSGHLAAVFD